MKKPLLLICYSMAILVAILSICTTVYTSSKNIQIAKEIIRQNSEGGEKGYRYVEAALHHLPHDDLHKLYMLIEEDRNRGMGHIIQPPLRVEQMLATRVLFKIKDKLGELPYEEVLKGHFVTCTGFGSGGNHWLFKTQEGEHRPVFENVSTIAPSFAYEIDPQEEVIIYVYKGPVIKIEQIP